MPRSKKSPNSLAQINLSESFTSLILGAFVILVATVLVFAFAKNRAQTIYDKINTAASTHQELNTPENTSSFQTKPKTYEVKSGDNLWTIAEKVYGSGYNWVDLASANNLKNPNIITAGTKLNIPDVQKITVATVQSVQNNSPNKSSISGTSYTIVKGDNLWTISIRAYGDGFKWPEIAKANNLKNPSLIHSGNPLKIPR